MFTLPAPPPSKAWNINGTVCFNLILYNNDTFIQEENLFSFGSFNITAVYFGFYSKLQLNIKNGEDKIAHFGVKYKNLHWISICLSFQYLTPTTQEFSMLESLGKSKQNMVCPMQNFSYDTNLKIYSHKFGLFAIKNLLLLDKAINQTEHLLMHWSNPYSFIFLFIFVEIY